MNYQEIEHRYIDAKQEALQERINASESLLTEYREKKNSIALRRQAKTEAFNLLLRNNIRRETNKKVDYLEKKANGTPQEALQSEQEWVRFKSENDIERMHIKEERRNEENKFVKELDEAKEEFNIRLEEVRCTAHHKLDVARTRFETETKEYQAWKRAQEIAKELAKENGTFC